MRTTATDSLLVLAGLLPIQFGIEERVVMQLFNVLSDSMLRDRLRIDEMLENHMDLEVHESSLQIANLLFSATKSRDRLLLQKASLTELEHPGNTDKLKVSIHNVSQN